MSVEPQRKWTAEEYLAFERQQPLRHEYQDGEILAMGGASRIHNRISWNITVALDPQLSRLGCEGFASDMRVRLASSERYTYPDIVVVCGEPEFEDAELDTLLNPTLILEILSPSTEDHDRGRKLFDYRSIPSVQSILLVAQDRVHVEQLACQGDGSWVLTEADSLDAVVPLHGIDAQLPLTDVYRRVPRLS
ncbi:MAG: Uma2 family endonuclease [Acidobacteriota bacterium]